MSLLLEVELLGGVSFAAVGPDSEMPDWPPQPDRVFSALVASWAARGEDPGEAVALEWLESLDPPTILASGSEPRTAATVFVPPNDPASGRKGDVRVLPPHRNRQARRFPAARPENPIVAYVWEGIEPEPDLLRTLAALAGDTAYIGHSASLTRCRFRTGEPTQSESTRRFAARYRTYRGRFAELRRAYQAGHRPAKGSPVASSPEPPQVRRNSFSDRWLILEHVGDAVPDVRASAIVTRAIRSAILGGYGRLGSGDRIPAAVSGHDPDGSPARGPHMAIVPLSFAGFPHADGHVMGYAIIPPTEGDLLGDDVFTRVLRSLAPLDERLGRRVMTVLVPEADGGPGSVAIRLSPTYEAPAATLDPDLYCAPSDRFATVTPIALDRHLKRRGEERNDEIRELISNACANAGFPSPMRILAGKHSAFEGVPGALPSRGSPPWMRWRQPESLRNRQLTHAVLEFEERVPGPLLLGAGRFLGLGLCRPLSKATGR